MKRRNTIFMAIGVCAAVIAIYFWLPDGKDRSPHIPPAPSVSLPEPQQEARTLPLPAPPAVSLPMQVEAAPVPVEDTQQPDAKVTASQIAIEQGLAKILSSIQRIEIANKHVIYDQRSSSLQIFGMEISRPTDEQMEEVHRTLTRTVNEVAALSPGTSAFNEMRERGGKLIKAYCDYPHPVKAIGYTERNGKSEFWEWYGPDIQMVMPDKKGYPIPTTNETALRFDFKFGEADSWAAKRYSHLFEFER